VAAPLRPGALCESLETVCISGNGSGMDLHYSDARTLSDLLARKELSATELMSSTLDRIAALNDDLNAVVSLRDADTLLTEA
jgi:amidase